MAHAINSESPHETRNAERVFSVKLGVAGSGAVVFTGTLEDALEHNRLRDGQSRVWREDGVAMTLPKLPGRLAVRLAEFHESELEKRRGDAVALNVPSGGGLRAVVEASARRVMRRRVA